MIVVGDWVRFEKCAQAGNLGRRVSGRPPAASVNQDQDRGIKFGVYEGQFAPFVVLNNEKCCIVEPRAREACRRSLHCRELYLG
jgi:hypothetical protein